MQFYSIVVKAKGAVSSDTIIKLVAILISGYRSLDLHLPALYEQMCHARVAHAQQRLLQSPITLIIYVEGIICLG